MKLITRPANPVRKQLSELSANLKKQLDQLCATNNQQLLTLFWVPIEDPEYRPGLSWLELFGTQITQIKRACSRFCTTFDSPVSYKKAADKFQGKPYCCVEVNEAGKLIYYRNQSVSLRKFQIMDFTKEVQL